MAHQLNGMLRFLGLLGVSLPLCAEAPAAPSEPSQIQDNSFLIEEAYNQEPGVVQHIHTFSRIWNTSDWTYTFTQEWPGLRNWRHQFSYTFVRTHAGAFPGTGGGLGDVALNYRYQLVGNGDSRFAFAPRLSLLVPTGDVTAGRGSGALGLQTNLPLSIALHRRLVTHWNAGATFVRSAQDWSHSRASTVGYNAGQSVVLLLRPNLNFLVETSANRYQSVTAPARTAWSTSAYVSPGVRWAYNFHSGLQIVPGIAVPIGVGPTSAGNGVYLYLSFEHPFRSRAGK